PDAGSFAQALRDVPHRTESWTGWMPGSAVDPVSATGEVATGASPAARRGGTPSGGEDDATAATMVIERWPTPPPAPMPVPMEAPAEAPGPTDAAADAVAVPVAKRDDGDAGTPAAVDGPVDENGRERVRLALAHVLGPIAGRVVRRAEARVAGPGDGANGDVSGSGNDDPEAGGASRPDPPTLAELAAACENWIPDERGRQLFRGRLAAGQAARP
ncbi:MAG: hypothetical protein INR65_10310, partial [Gluconacetobacter diazotrophicus]|nr:hypothetical protein [Gluconacetobacter diazotrophicus]